MPVLECLKLALQKKSSFEAQLLLNVPFWPVCSNQITIFNYYYRLGC